jgi:proline-specific peptidase
VRGSEQGRPADASARVAREGRTAVRGGEVAYRVLEGGPGVPLLVLHGGPGWPSMPLGDAVGTVLRDRPVVTYDQLGSGRSDRPDDTSLWTVERFVEELGQVRDALELDEVHLLGHSWGSMLAASYLATGPAGVRSAVLSSPCLDARAWQADQRAWLAQLPAEQVEVVERCEADGTTDSPAYRVAMQEFYRRHVCRLDPWPPEVEQMFADVNEDVYGYMWGVSEFTATGTLREFDATPGLASLRLPVLFVCGEFDEARPETVRRQAALVPGGRVVEVPGASHLPLLERSDLYWSAVASFLDDLSGH